MGVEVLVNVVVHGSLARFAIGRKAFRFLFTRFINLKIHHECSNR